MAVAANSSVWECRRAGRAGHWRFRRAGCIRGSPARQRSAGQWCGACRLFLASAGWPPRPLAESLRQGECSGGQADAGIEVEFYNRSVAMRQDRIARRDVQQLPGARRWQRKRFFARIGRLARDELRMRRVGNQDGQAQLGRRQRQVLVKRRKRGNSVIDGFGRGANGGQHVAVRLHVRHRDRQEPMRLLRPENPAVPDEGQNPVPVRAAGVDAFGAVDPAFEDFINGGVEVFDPAADLGVREPAKTGGKVSAAREAARMTATAFDPPISSPVSGARGAGRPCSPPGEFAVCSIGNILTWNQITDFI